MRLTVNPATGKLEPSPSVTGFLTKSQADTYYYPLNSNPAGYLTSISGQDLSTADNSTSQFTTLSAVAGVGYLTASSTLDATKLSGALPALDGSALTGVLHAESDTLATVTARGATTTVSSSFQNAVGIVLGKQDTANIPGYLKLIAAGANSAYYSVIQTGTQTNNAIYTLPTALPTNNNSFPLFATAGSGVMTWGSFPITVAQGGTGLTSMTAYGILCGGTTTTGNVQVLAPTSTLWSVLVSGANATGIPQWASGLTWSPNTGSGAFLISRVDTSNYFRVVTGTDGSCTLSSVGTVGNFTISPTGTSTSTTLSSPAGKFTFASSYPSGNDGSLLWDYETTINKVAVSSPSTNAITLIDFGSINLSMGDIKASTYHVGATAGIDATIQITKDATLGQTVNGSATFSKGILTAYTAPS